MYSYDYRDLVKFSFSPQLYFVQTMCVSGTLLVLLGFQGIMNNKVSPFGDGNLFIFLTINFAIIFVY